jgi:hypothetical protein
MPSRHREEAEVLIHKVGARSGEGCQYHAPAALLPVSIVWEADVDGSGKSRTHRGSNPPTVRSVASRYTAPYPGFHAIKLQEYDTAQ